MAETSLSFFSLIFSVDSPIYHHYHHPTMLLCTLFFFFFTLSICSIALCLFFLLHTHKTLHRTQTDPSIFTFSSTRPIDKPRESNPTQLARSLLLEILPPNSPNWDALFQGKECATDPVSDGSVMDSDGDAAGDLGVQKSVDKKKKKKKKRAKKKRSDSPNSKGENDGDEERCNVKDELGLKEKQELMCMFPFTSSSSPTQRKIKQHFDQLVKCHESKKMTLAQIGQFANCLIEVRHELQHKSEVIQRRFTIAKALLHKADRSSFDRLSQQIYKLEMEQKRLEEDALVYNLLQQQLKLSPAYKKMLEISACLEELKAKSGELMESTDPEFSDISFEEFLAQEKKDSFWQRNGKSKSYAS